MIACGTSVTLRPPCAADETALVALRNDVGTQTLTVARARPADAARTWQWVRRHLDDPASLFFIVADTESDTFLGFAQLNRISPVDGTAWMGIALAVEARGRGVGAAALQGLFGFAKRTHRVRKVCLEVRADHYAAIALYERLGFQRIGVHKGHVYLDGSYVDILLMEMLL
ncbi:MAG: RimJ/RimL family protein N-acetyltransferase [Bradymonadia bacterium]